MTSQRYRAAHKMADMCYYGNVMTTTRWRLYVTMETLWQQQDGGYALLWKRFLHLQQYSHRLNFNLFFLNLMTKINVFSHCFQSLSRAHTHSKPVSTGSSLARSKAPAGSLKVFRWLKTSVAVTYIYRTAS